MRLAPHPAANQSCRPVAQNIAIEIRQQKQIELVGVLHQLHRGIIDDQLSILDFRIFGGYLSDAIQEKAIGELPDVGFMNRMDLFAPARACVLKGETSDPRRSLFRNNFQADNYTRYNCMLDSGIQIFRVLSDQHHIQVTKQSGNPQGQYRPRGSKLPGVS